MMEKILFAFRSRGWRVAAHNDYDLDGVTHTFWLLTHAASGRFCKGEAISDERALKLAWTQGIGDG